MLSLCLAVLAAGLCQADTFSAPGYGVPVSGAWYVGGKAASAMPLGALGTGFIDLTAAATFGDSTVENNWLQPAPVGPKCGFVLRVAGKSLDLFPGATVPDSVRFWGHYPAADVDFGSTFGDVAVHMRAFTPLIPRDYVLSQMPAALFHFTLTNNGAAPAPAEIVLNWQALLEKPTEAEGNVEGALGWRRASLASGATWSVAPTIVFAADRDALPSALAAARIITTPLTPTETANGNAYRFGAVDDFLLDPAGGFDWETTRHASAHFYNFPNIGQVFWRIDYGTGSAGRGARGAYGLANAALPAKTRDGALEVALRVAKAGPDSVALEYSFRNVSEHELTDLRFGLSLNADVGGTARAETQRASFDSGRTAIVFADRDLKSLVALAGVDAGYFVLDAWPHAHEAMEKNDWVSVHEKPPALTAESVPEGIQLKTPRGSYAVASSAADGWALQNMRVEENIIRSSAEKTIAPGQSADVFMLLAWHFPSWISSDREKLTHLYALVFQDAGKVASLALPRAKEIEDRIIKWQERIYAANVPPLLKDCVINSLYIWPRNAWWLEDGRFFQNESFTGCPITETFVCRFNGSFPLALFYPDCEKATMRAVAKAQKKSGEIPFGIKGPMGSRSPYYHCQHPIVSPEFVLTTWRNYALWQDAPYLDEMYTAVQAALRFSMTLDKDKDGLVNDDPGNDKGFPANQYYDIWPWWGTSAYVGGIWLAALRAGEEMAKVKGDTAFATELRGWFDKGASAFNEKLWTGSYYRLYNDPSKKKTSDTSLTNALCGQWFAYATGLGELVPAGNIRSVIDTVLRLNVAATPYAAVNGVKPDGSVDESYTDHSAVITIGEVWNFCAMAAFAGRADDAVILFNTSYENILVRQKTPWNIPWSLDRKTGAIKWGVNYYSNPCVWTLFQALDPNAFEELKKK